MMKPELLTIICCPACKNELIIDDTHKSLTCSSCSAVYEIQDDIPILLPKNNGK